MRRFFFSIFMTLIVGFIAPLLARDGLKIETFRGSEIAPHFQEVVKLCEGIYREYPYLYNGDNAEYAAYVESYSNMDDAIICLAFDGENAVGLAMGVPMLKTRDIYKQVLVEHGYELADIFYLGEFGVKSEFRNQGIEEEMYLKVEKLVRDTQLYNKIGFWEIDDPYYSSETVSKNKLWEKLGFIKYSNLNFQIFWTNIGDTMESAHKATYSFKFL